MMSRKILSHALSLLTILVLALSGCSDLVPSPFSRHNQSMETDPTAPHFMDDTANCPWKVEDISARLPGGEIRCGTVNVPEFHGQPDSPQLHLAVLVAQRNSAAPSPEAVIYLAGGPGNRVFAGSLLDFIDAGRDLILFDQRGVGNSAPALTCPTVGNRDPMLAAEQAQTALASCRDEWIQKHVQLSAYTIPEDAADVNDIRQALGYVQLDLVGVSYGTRLALAVMRAYPQIVRSAVLDSVLPMQARVIDDLPGDLERALNLAFSTCAGNATCNQTYPNLKSTFVQLVDHLNADPEHLTIGGKDLRFTGNDLISLLLSLLLDGPQEFPDFITRLQNGDTSLLSQYLVGIQEQSNDTAWVMSFSMACSDGNFSSLPVIDSGVEKIAPELRDPLRTGVLAIIDLCHSWPVSKLPADQSQPVRSNIPTLVLEGTFDPITPPSYGKLAAQTLLHSLYVEFPDRGHAVIKDTCSLQIVNQFIQLPNHSPDTHCVANLTDPFGFTQTEKTTKIGFMVSRTDILAAVAPVLHLRVEQLDQVLTSGQSLADIAKSQNVPVEVLRDALLAEIQKEIDTQVQKGSLSQTDAAQIYQKVVQGGADQMINMK